MAKQPYPYPDDEFDQLARQQVPRGNHRMPRSFFRRVGPWILVIALMPLMAYGAVTALTKATVDQKMQAYAQQQAEHAEQEELAGEEDPAATEGEDTGNGEGGTAGETGENEAPATDPDEADEPEEEPEPVFEPDHNIDIHVKNAGGISGLAARGSQILLDAGYVSVEPMNNDYDFTPRDSVVYYDARELEDQALYVAELMGIETVERSITWTSAPITVILTATF